LKVKSTKEVKMQKFEYKTEKYYSHHTTKVDPEKGVEVPATVWASELMAMDLPQKGEQGWELVSMIGQGGDIFAVFKRLQVSLAEKIGPFITKQETPQKLLPVFLDPNVPVNESETTGPLKRPLYTLDVTSGPGSGVRFPVPVAPTPAQHNFPGRDYSTGFPDPECSRDGCRGCRKCQR
jgi:hypothetical protein